MATHHRHESPKLHPADIELLELRISCGGVRPFRVVRAGEEATDVTVDIRIGCERIVQADGHLLTEAVPRGADIPTPCLCTSTLLSGKVASRENISSLLLVHCFLVVIYPLHGLEREEVSDASEGPHCRALVEVALLEAGVIGIRGVHPPCVDAHIVESLEVVPIDVSSLVVIDIVYAYSTGIVHTRWPERESALWPSLKAEQHVLLLHLAESFCMGSE